MTQLRNQLAIRGLVALALAVVGYPAVTRSFASVLSVSDPISALNVSGGNARIMARAAQTMMEAAKTDADRRRAVQLARLALSRDGTAVPAVTTVGFFSGLDENNGDGADWFAYSQRLSRRDLRTQLYFIEKSVSEGNIVEALRHYDIALRTSDNSAPTVLYPVLRGAIANEGIRREFAKTLARQPLWADAFIGDLVLNGPDFVVVADLLADARRRGAKISSRSDSVLLGNLVASGQIPTAWNYYLTIHPDAGKLLVRNGKFSADPMKISPFDWRLVNGDGVSTDLGAADNDGALEYHLAPTIGGPVVSQLTLLPTGKYRVESTLIEASQNVGVGPYWELKCASGQSIGSLEMGGPISAPKAFSVDVAVPQNCGAQLLTLIVRSSDDVQGATGQVGSMSITRIP